MTDGQLLREFVNGTDPSCFQSIVDRHGPMVMGVCRRVLGDQHEADDAFQSTFMVLMNKAQTLQDPDRLAEWLRGVAIRVAVRSRRKASRRREREALAAEQRSRPHSSDSGEHSLKELMRSISEEFDRLPDSYRLPLMLCGLEGMTHEQAASRLGWPLGTVKIRLFRGRKLLKERLKRRGFASAAVLAALLWKGPTGSDAATFDARWAFDLDGMGEIPPENPISPPDSMSGTEPKGSSAPDRLGVEERPDRAIEAGKPRHARFLILLVLLISSVVGGVIAIQAGRNQSRRERSWPAVPIGLSEPEPTRRVRPVSVLPIEEGHPEKFFTPYSLQHPVDRPIGSDSRTPVHQADHGPREALANDEAREPGISFATLKEIPQKRCGVSVFADSPGVPGAPSSGMAGQVC